MPRIFLSAKLREVAPSLAEHRNLGTTLPHEPPLPGRVLVAVAILSGGMLAFQITLTRLFAVAQFYHFAFLVISLALLGLGCAGSLLTVWPHLARTPSRWAAGFGTACVVTYVILNRVPFDSYAIAWDRRQIVYLILTLLGTTLPFLFSGLVLSGLMAQMPQQLHRIYAANLGGSGLGCLLVLAALQALGGEAALFLSAAAGAAAAMLLMPPTRSARMWAAQGTLALLAGGLIIMGVAHPNWAALRLSPYKGLAQAMLTPDAELVLSEWTSAARIDVVESKSIHAMPGLSQNAMFMRPPDQMGLTLDADNLQPITGLSPDDELARTLAAHVPQAVIPALRPDTQSMLILYPGGGWDVLMALANGVPSATVVERHAEVVRLLRGPFEAFSGGIYTDPRVTILEAQGRTAVRRIPAKVDIVLVSLSDSFHPVTSGALSLSEDYRYTVEAIDDYLNRLAPGGLLVITRWLQTPPTEDIRTLATIEAALARRGVEEPGNQLAAFRELRTITFVAGNQPFSEADLVVLRAFSDAQGYDLVWLPGLAPEEVNQHNRLPRPIYYEAASALLADPGAFIQSYEFDIRPPTDDRPFFFHFFRWAQTPELLAEMGHTWQPFGGSGTFVLVALLAIVLVFALVFILGPLTLKQGRAGPVAAPTGIRVRTLAYFSMLGLGYLFIEIPLAQHFILFLDDPVTALAIVIFALLVFSGIGSATAPRWRLDIGLGLLIGVTLLAPVLFRAVFDAALGLPLGVRIGIVIASLAPLGLLMGIPFVRGIGLIEQAAPGLIPWAWAINGSASVISGVVAVMIALSWGFSAVLWIGAGCYALALIIIWPLHRRAAA